MQPQPRRLPQAFSRCLRLAVLSAGVALAAMAPAAHAQGSPSPVLTRTADSGETEQIRFEADKVEYDTDAETVTATGNVILRREEQSVRASTVTWNRQSGQIVAAGNIRLVDEDGNVLYTERVELTDELKAGMIENLLLVLREGGRLAADSGMRDENGGLVLNNAAYTACAVEDGKGCPKKPSWKLTAARVIYDPVKRKVYYKGALFHLFGVPLLPLPGLGHTSDFRAESGLLIPDFRLSASNGVEVSDTYYLRLGDNRDLALTGYVYTQALPMLSAKYRQLTGDGAFQVTGYATRSSRIPLGTGTKTDDFRGYIETNGKFQFDDNWSFTASGRLASDRTFLRRYDISRDDRLRSTANLERITPDSYLSIAGWATQTLRVGDAQGLVPVALPVIDYRHRFGLAGGKLELQANSMAIARTSGQDTQRAFAKAQWDLRRITPWGQEVTLTGLVRGDVYHSDENGLTTTAIYRGNPGWEYRGIATAALDMKWPLVGEFLGGTQVFTPRLQVVATPSVPNLDIPNEDARAIDLEDSNLFALNRFPGYDRIEDGVRFTYGFDWRLNGPGFRVSTTVGQSYRLTSEPTLLPDGTGLSSRTSDIVGRTEVRFADIVKLTYRFRLDKDSFAIRRNEADLTVGDHRTYAEIGYLRLNRNIAPGFEDLRDREELRVSGRVAFADYWSVFGSAVVNLTDRNEDPQFNSDGFQVLRHRLGFAYGDECLDLAFTWRRDYVATGDARRGNTFQISFALRNIGFK
jgi:LPS-assembly protein